MQIQYEDEEAHPLISSKLSQWENHQTKGSSEIPTPSELPTEIIHKVLYGDTLEGLSLEYEVPIGKIRARNHIQGDSLYHLKEIVIPDPRRLMAQKQQTQEMLIEEMVSRMDYSEKSTKVARYYLIENNWSVQEAMKEFKEDLQWERQNRNKIVTRPIDGPGFEMKDIKKFYDKMDLLNKKKA